MPRAWRLLLCGFLLPLGLWAQDECGLQDTLLVPVQSTGSFSFDIANYVNNDLGNPDQGLCGINLRLTHQYVYDFTLSLTSPAGQTIRLIGPVNDQPRPQTLFTRWNIGFVPCAETAVPDNGFPAQWDNNLFVNWVSGTLYKGSYYPNQGCLEDFDSGPVNGTWTISVVSDRPFAVGAITGFELVFCDPTGLDCCFADAGQIAPDTIARFCENDTGLLLDIPVTYPDTILPPDTSLYDYTYLVVSSDSVAALDTLVDLRNYAVGTYEICGLSYLRADRDSLPAVGDPLVLPQLRDTLNSFFPPFCADLSDACRTVQIFAPPDTVFLEQTICTGDVFRVGSTEYNTTGVFDTTLPSFGNCDSIVRLDLTVVDAFLTELDTTVCFGESVIVGGETFSATGSYTVPLVSSIGCDSIVTLDLSVRPENRTSLEAAICAGDTLWVAGTPLTTAGTYTLDTLAATGCDSLIDVDLVVLSPEALLDPLLPIDCYRNGLTTVDAGPSTGQFPLTYQWISATGTELGAESTVDLTAAGDYRLVITESTRGTTCRDSLAFTVEDIRAQPTLDIAPPDTFTCERQNVVLSGVGQGSGPAVEYVWSTTDGALTGPVDLATATATAPGTYQLAVTDSVNGCQDSLLTTVVADTLAPLAAIEPPGTISCANPEVVLASLPPGQEAAELEYRWSGPCWEPLAGQDSIRVSCGGTYVLEIRNTRTGCVAMDSVEVIVDSTSVTAAVTPPEILNCLRTTVVLDATPTTPNTGVTYQWSGPLGFNSAQAAPSVTVPGDYFLRVERLDNGCTDSLLVTVVADTLQPVADAGPDTALTCIVLDVTIGGPGTTISDRVTYDWSRFGNPGFSATTPTLTVPDAGIYTLVVTDTISGCRDTSQVQISLDRDMPFVRIDPPEQLGCFTSRVQLDASDTNLNFPAELTWLGDCLEPDSTGLLNWASCPGTYGLIVTNTRNGCSSNRTVEVTLAQNAVVAVLPDTALLDCQSGTVILDNTGTSPEQIDWFFNGEQVFLSDFNPEVSEPGVYTLAVSNITGTCTDTASVVVTTDCPVLARIAGPDSVLTCLRTSVLLDGSESQSTGEVTYEWLGPTAACIEVLPPGNQIRARCPGEYRLVVTNTTLGVSDTASVIVESDTTPPVAEAGPPDTLTCLQTSVSLDGLSGSSTGFFIRYRWTDAEDNLLDTLPIITVATPGTYLLEVTDLATGCRAVDQVQVAQDRAVPDILFPNTTFPCESDTFRLAALILPNGDYNYRWAADPLLAGTSDSAAFVTSPGTFTLEVENQRNGCTTEADATVVPDECAPCLTAPDTLFLTCFAPSTTIQVSLCDFCVGCTYQWSREGTPIPGATNLNLPVTTPGMYELLAVTPGGLQGTIQVTVATDQELPYVPTGPDRLLTCDSTDVLLGETPPAGMTGFSYAWESPSGLQFLPRNNPFLTVSDPGTYYLTVTSSDNGCMAVDSVNVTLDTLPPVAEAGPMVQLTCSDDLLTLDGIGSSTGGIYRYRWLGQAENCLEGRTTLNPIVSCPGTYYLEVRNRVNGCRSIDSTTVSAEVGLPILDPFPDTTLTCRLDTVVLDAMLPAGVSARWCRLDAAGNEDILSCRFNEAIAVGTPGRYRLTAENESNGCLNGYTVTVSEDVATPTVDAGPGATFFCTLDSLVLTGEVGTTEAPLRYEWSSAQGVPIGQSDSLMATVYFPDRYYLQAENTRNGCVAIDSVTIAQDAAAPQAFAGLDTTLNCQRRQLRLSGIVNTLSGQRNIEWQTTDGRIVSGGNTLQPLVDRPGTYLLIVTDPVNACATADAVVVTEDVRKPEAIVTALDTTQLDCRLDTLRYSAMASMAGSGGELNYTWRSLSTGGVTPDVDPVTARLFRAGNYQLIVTDPANACRDTSLFTVTVDRRTPRVDLNNPPPLTCLDTVRTLRAVNTDTGPDFRYTWLTGNGDTLAQSVLQLSVTSSGTYRLRLTDVRNGCTAFAERAIMADREAPVINIAPPADLGCERSSVVLDAGASGPDVPLDYQWTAVSGTGISGAANLPVATVTEPGTYVLTLVNERNGCTAQDSIVVEQLTTAIDSVLLDFVPPSCVNANAGTVVVQGVEGGTGPYRYRLDDGRASERLVYTDISLGTHTLTVIDANGCVLQVPFEFTAPEESFVDLGPDLFIQLGDSVLLQFRTDLASYDTLIWETTGPLPQPGAATQWVAPRETQRYRLTLVTPEGCRVTDEVLITVGRDYRIYVPSGFSPNGDGFNDLIFPFGGKEVVRVIRWRIYDRWGNLVHDRGGLPPGDPALGWDGRFDGRPLNPAVFVYQLEIEIEDGRTLTLYGDLALVR